MNGKTTGGTMTNEDRRLMIETLSEMKELKGEKAGSVPVMAAVSPALPAVSRAAAFADNSAAPIIAAALLRACTSKLAPQFF